MMEKVEKGYKVRYEYSDAPLENDRIAADVKEILFQELRNRWKEWEKQDEKDC